LLVRRSAEQWQGYVYELLYAGEGQDGSRFVTGLLDLESLNHDYDGKRSGSGRGAVGGQSVGGRSGKIDDKASDGKASEEDESSDDENAQEG
jgi:hypothetical protein